MAAMKFGVFSRPKHKRDVSGDAYTIQERDEFIVVAVVDGLGSGEEAAKASRTAVEQVERDCALPLMEILRRCHRALRNTRGAVMGLLRVEPAVGQMRYVGVGNVGIYVLSQEPFHPISYNGIVGYRLPRVHEFVGAYHPGDTLVFYTDGVDLRFHGDAPLLRRVEDPQKLAEAIARRYGKDNDDVCVLVAR
jgi:negative regulator of sigma-B (phosphoserine phosphatase)